MTPKRKPLRRADDLLAAGLISPERRAGIEVKPQGVDVDEYERARAGRYARREGFY